MTGIVSGGERKKWSTRQRKKRGGEHGAEKKRKKDYRQKIKETRVKKSKRTLR